MNKLTLLLPLFTLALLSTGFGQQVQEYTFTGFFRGTNLNVQCRESPIKPWKECECFDSIAVNQKVVPDILYNGFQIDIANKTSVELFDTVSITFYYKKGCDFRLLNPNHFLPKIIEPVDTLYFDEDHILHWQTAQNFPQLQLWVQIEQYKWGDWVKIGKNYPITLEKSYKADVSSFFHNGANQFRAVVASIDHHRIPSDTVSIKIEKPKNKVRIKKGDIYFKQKTHYEVYDSNIVITTKGYGKVISLSSLNIPEGVYTLKYDNEMIRLELKNGKLKRL